MNKNFDEKKNIIADEELEKVSAGYEIFFYKPAPELSATTLESSNYVGGLCGYNEGKIENSYNCGDVCNKGKD